VFVGQLEDVTGGATDRATPWPAKCEPRASAAAWRIENLQRATVPSDTRMLEVILASLSAEPAYAA
jgi:hypothetical protein